MAVQMGCELGKLVEWLWPPIKCHLDYWRCFRSNVQGLRDEIGLLEREKRNMDQKIEVARLRAESPTTDVQGWLEVGDKKLEEAEGILQGCDGLKAWNIVSRYSWGKRAKKTAERIARLRNEANVIRIFDPAPPPIPHKPTTEFESRRSIEEDIMKFLRDDHTYMIAICGARGIGKTTMVHRIEDRVRKENLFDEVVCVVVSQQFDLLKIQEEIAEFLGLEFSENSLAARAHKLRIRLQDSKRKLIIFDDVWESFKLEDIGVPFENGFTECKIILTSRITNACNKMGAKIIPMELLKEEEAWDLFKEKAGSYVEGLDLRPIAENVVAECKGLPVALVTVGVALKDQSIDVWKDSLSQLRISMPIDIYDVIKDVYKPLKLSYDFLENESAKSLFLLCCLFREDYNIPILHLTLYGLGLGMFQGIRNIEEGRSRARSVVAKLKSRFLLLDGHRRRHSVKMHDVVRDVAIFIGSKEKDGFFMNSLEAFSMDSSTKDSSRNCNWMSIDISTENAKLPVVGSDFPNLRFMMIRGVPNKVVDGNNVICFEGMQGLKVLSISDVYFRSLPSTMELLKELRTLRLENSFVKDISVLGELACLEILCIHGCYNIEELPTDIGRLNFLRLLELSYCFGLQRIVAGVISSLVRLEELKIVYCAHKWEAKGNQSEERNAGLSELESLPNLTSLEIDIFDCNLLTEEICLSHKLVRYKIRTVFFKNKKKIRTVRPYYLSEEYERETGLYLYAEEYERGISLDLPGDITLGNWIRQLARSTQSLVLIMSTEFPVKPIKLGDLEEIIYGTIPEVSNFIQKLESIHIAYLPKLAHLWKSPNQSVSLGNLTSIYISGCANLCYLFSVATARSLVQLERLEIEDCDKIEQVFWNGMESNTDTSIIEFPNLREMRLFNLPNLAAFSQGVESIEFPKLEEMRIGNLPRLKSLLPWDLEAATHDHHSLHFFCNPKNVSLGNLKSVSIKGCPNLCSLFSVATARSLVQLQSLRIEDCDKIKQVLWNGMESNTYASIIEFPNLQKLRLSKLPNLAAFSQGVESIEFPKLEEMWIYNLPRLKSFLPWDLEATHAKNVWLGNLKSIYIRQCPNLCHLFSVATARSLVQLQDLEIPICDKIEQVLWNGMESNTNGSIIVFPNLQKLTLSDLPNLADFSQGVESIEFPKLQELILSNLPNLAAFSQGVEIIELPNLEEMRIYNLRRLKSLWPWDLEAATHDHHSPYLFCNAKNVSLGNLKSIYIRRCANLCYLFSVATARSLVPLQDLEIPICDKIEQVSWNGMESNTDASIIQFPNLQKLRLSDLPNLAAFSQGVESIEFPKLQELILSNLPNLAAFSQGVEIIEFPNLEEMRIYNLRRLKSLWPWDLEAATHDHHSPYLFCNTKNVSLGNLKSIFIRECANLCYLFSVATSRSLVQLECLEIVDCDMIEQVFWNGMESNTDASIIEFPNLQELRLYDLPNLAAFSQGVEIIESLHQLTRLTIKDCPKLRTKIGKCPNLRFVNFTDFSGPHRLHCSGRTIYQIVISNCDTIEEILWDEIKDEGEHHIIFPELMELELHNLPCFATFCRGAESIEFPKLEWIKIGNLPRLNSLLPLDLEATHDDHHSLHFFCNPKVEFPGQKKLDLFQLQDAISKIWCRHIPINFFHNLESLRISDVNGISNLISSLIAENLVNLKYLSIERCREIVDVIEDEKEAFATTPFRNLEELSIKTLHKLRSFCQWKHALELPSLTKVEIVECPGMETFTLGSLSTPYLFDFTIDHVEVETEDLNGAIRDQFGIKDEDEDDEHENSSEDKKEAEDGEKVESSKSKFL